jgi:hypothetical protein
MTSKKVDFSYFHVLLFVTFTVLNLLTHEKYIGVLISIPQFIIVFVLIIQNKLEKAFLYHLIFTLTCLAVPFSQLVNPGAVEFGLYNYSKLKIFGPVGVFHILILAIFISKLKSKLKFNDDNLLKLLFNSFFYFAITGFVFGLIGLAFFDYYLVHFVSYTIYIFILIIHFILLLQFNTKEFLDKIYNLVCNLLISAPIASFFLFLIGESIIYGNKQISIMTEVGYFSCILVFSLFQFNKIILPLISFIIGIFLLSDGGSGGKGIIFTVLILILFLYKVLLKKNISNPTFLFRRKIIFLFSLPILFFLIYKSSMIFSNLFIYKFESILQLVNVFNGFDFFYLIPESPRIRIISSLNIWYEQITQNLFSFFIGNGFGAYFYDNFNFFSNMRMKGAFRPEEIISGKYGRPHDTFAAVPLANGLIGLFLILKLTYYYTKRALKYNFLGFSAILFLGLAFYFNSQLGLAGLLMLFASFKKI